MNLVLFLIIPLLTVVLLLLARTATQVRAMALAGAAVQAVCTVILYFSYRAVVQNSEPGLLYFEQIFPFYPSWNISFHIGVDGISIAMMLLTSWVVLAGVLISRNITDRKKEYHVMLILLSLGAYGFFMSVDLLIQFFFLELAVIPKYLLIAIWGSGRKAYSANKLALLLMGGSALILVGLLMMYYAIEPHTFNWKTISGLSLPTGLQMVCFPLLFLGFGIFSAIFPFHTWVPDGHSSAPTAGSMFLAGISMKLGGFGCLKVASYLFPDAAVSYAPWVVGLSAIAIIYGAFVTLMQKDLKYMNAYSSISHCGFVLLGIGMITHGAISGAVLQMISHGLMTALFFAIIGMVYARTHTREIAKMGGLMRTMPFVSTMLFIVGFCSLGLPGLSGFVAEMTVFVGSWERTGMFYRTATVLACISIVVTAVYILRAVGKVVMGPMPEAYVQTTDAAGYEKFVSVWLLLAILLIGVFPGWLVELIEPAVNFIQQRFQLQG